MQSAIPIVAGACPAATGAAVCSREQLSFEYAVIIWGTRA
jgi:hypothetical protein